MSVKKYLAAEDLGNFFDVEIRLLQNLANSVVLKKQTMFGAYELLKARHSIEMLKRLKDMLVTYNSSGNPVGSVYPNFFEFDSRAAIKNSE